MKVVVLGAGVIGTTSAWYLAKAGHEVTVIDRQADAALETSYANGGQISVAHAEPWANPGMPLQILKWLMRDDAPMLFRPRAELAQWQWGLRFLAECLPGRAHDHTVQLLAIASYSRKMLQALRAETGIQYDQIARGILHICTNQKDFDTALATAAEMQKLGCNLQPRSVEECYAIEPALKSSSMAIVGATHAVDDESGDARKFTQGLARLCVTQGVRFRYGSEIRDLRIEGGRVSAVAVGAPGSNQADDMLSADAFVVALGSYSAPMLRRFGIPLAIYPAKGYSITIPETSETGAPTVPLGDTAAKIVISRLGNRLRVAGTAELNGYNMSIEKVRCEAIVKRTFELFPQAGERSNIEFWTGLRPATPSNVPYIGWSRFPNLYLNTGHGTLGWTMACGSGQAIADIVSGKQPDVDFRFCMV
jgi:D-amino-acid dehydrogenase